MRQRQRGREGERERERERESESESERENLTVILSSFRSNIVMSENVAKAS